MYNEDSSKVAWFLQNPKITHFSEDTVITMEDSALCPTASKKKVKRSKEVEVKYVNPNTGHKELQNLKGYASVCIQNLLDSEFCSRKEAVFDAVQSWWIW